MEVWIPAYVRALTKEIEMIGKAAPEPISVHTIFLGGGTPSLLLPEQVKEIHASILDSFDVRPEVEFSMEANPGTVSLESLTGYREAGVNRLSFGMQSGNLDELALLQRSHSPDDVKQAVANARQAGFENINLDLIFGIPNQTMATWRDSLDVALSLGIEHLSLYNLTIEEGTPLFEQVKTGAVIPIEDDLAADMYEGAIDKLAQSDFLHYEISNWAGKRDGVWKVCQHNLQYWRNLPYLGFGVGAHSYFDGLRMENSITIPGYLKRIEQGRAQFPISPASTLNRRIPKSEQMQDSMMLGLRLLEEGVRPADFRDRWGVGVDELFGEELKELYQLGLIEGLETICLTQRGMMIGNQVFMKFVGDQDT